MTGQTIQADQNTAVVLRSLIAQANGEPLRVLLDGEQAIVIQTDTSFQQFVAEIEYAETVAGIKRGLVSKQAGDGIPFEQFKQEMETKFGISADEEA